MSNRKLINVFIISLTSEKRQIHCFAGSNMEATEELVEGQMPTNEEENNNENNEVEQNEKNVNKSSEIWIHLNESKNQHSSELLQTMKNLQEELLSMKVDNERILKNQ